MPFATALMELVAAVLSERSQMEKEENQMSWEHCVVIKYRDKVKLIASTQ